MTPHLWAKQHQVYTPTLTGLGERSHLAGPDINLDTHIQDVVNVFQYEDLQNVILVGHSYSGMVITGVADRLPGRLAHLVYLDAIVPRDGQALFDDWSPAGREAVREEARAAGEAWRWPIPGDLEELSSLAGMTEADMEWLRAKAVAHPLETFAQPLHLVNPDVGDFPRTYILCTAERKQFPDYVERARTDPDWHLHELPTGHWPMLTMPKELAALLLDIT